ncbi:uncharacterized protein LOC128236275 [Mya arenaria]|uniref:uncharacterized protein LOC128236275 n=1 Tax=Mya arenaria TaxID=6604 RepID=UPI0022DFCE4E|nr:uncharacterized protein LOC128236275 [Mya arenaria]
MDYFAMCFFVNVFAIVFNDYERARVLIQLYILICCAHCIIRKLVDICSSNNKSTCTCICLGKLLLSVYLICVIVWLLFHIDRWEVLGSVLFYILTFMLLKRLMQFCLKISYQFIQLGGEETFSLKMAMKFCKIYLDFYDFLKDILKIVFIMWVMLKISESSKQDRCNYTTYFCSGICLDQIYNCAQKEDRNSLEFDLFMISTNLVPGIQIIAHRIQYHIKRQGRIVFVKGRIFLLIFSWIVLSTYLVVYSDTHGKEFMANTFSKCTQVEFINGKRIVQIDSISSIAITRYEGEDVQFIVPSQRNKTDYSYLSFIKDDPGQPRAYPVVSGHVNLYGLMEPDSGIYELGRTYLSLKYITNDSVLSTAINRKNQDCPQIRYNLTVIKPEVRYIVPRFRGVLLQIVYFYKCFNESDVFNVHYTVNGEDINGICENDFLSCSLGSWFIKKLLKLNKIEINRVEGNRIAIDAYFCVCIDMYGRHDITIQRDIYNATSKSFEIVNFPYPVQVVIVPNNTYPGGTVRNPPDPRSNDFILKMVKESETLTVELPVFGEISIYKDNFLRVINISIYLALLYISYTILRLVLAHCCNYLKLIKDVLSGRWLQPRSKNFAHLNCDGKIKYDVFLSYIDTQPDYAFAENIILQYLEHRCHFKVYFPNREFANASAIPNISAYFNACEMSNHFVVVLSRAYLEDTDCNEVQLTHCILPILTSSEQQGRKLVIVKIDSEARLPDPVRHWPDVEVIEWTSVDDDMRHKAKLKTILGKPLTKGNDDTCIVV